MNPHTYAEDALAELFTIASVRFGNAIKGFWFYDREICPGCQGTVTGMKHKGEEALSLNAFIYRKPGILIGYLLCKRCARQVCQAALRNPMVQTSLHGRIEENLIAAYQRHVNALAA